MPMRLTTLVFDFSLQGGAEAYFLTKVLPLPYLILHLYATGEPSPNQLLWTQIFKWPNTTPPPSGVPNGPTIFNDLVQAPKIRIGRIPIDDDLDITIQDEPILLVYCKNDNTTQQQGMVSILMGLQ